MSDKFIGLDKALRDVLEDFRTEIRTEIRAEVQAEMDRKLDALRKEIRDQDEKRCLTIAETCRRYNFSRSTWDRWLADHSNGLRKLLDKWSAGTRLRVPVLEFESWLKRHASRSARRKGPGVAESRA